MRRGERRRLPKKRQGFTHEVNVGKIKLILRTGEYEDGTLGEIFVDTSTKQEADVTIRGLMNSFAISVSLGLQYGVPLEKLVEQFTYARFVPSGPVVGDERIKLCTSLIDYVFRVLGLYYLKKEEYAHVPKAKVIE